MMAVEGSTITSRIKNLLRSPSIKLRRSKAGNRREDLSSKSCVCSGELALPLFSSSFRKIFMWKELGRFSVLTKDRNGMKPSRHDFIEGYKRIACAGEPLDFENNR
ncbi:mitogen-activated protein kinase-binding protein 1 isoform X7 [Prionailurus iriomotensis]